MESRTNEYDFSYDVTCPIGQEIMVDPVNVIPCGHTFERENISPWTEHNATCPVCNQHIVQSHFVPNIALRNIIEKLLTLYPENLFSGPFVARLIKEGNIDQIVKIFKIHPDKINEALVDGETALHLAVMEGKLALIEALFSNFASLNINSQIVNPGQANHGRTPLFLAAYQAKAPLSILKFLLDKGADPSLCTAKGENPLLVAIWNMKWKRVITLLDSGKALGINQKASTLQQKDVTPLICAVEKNCSLEIFQRLLAVKDIDINARRATGESALFTAAASGQEDKVKTLLAMEGIDPAAKRHPGDRKTAMQAAAPYPAIVALFTSPEVKFLLVKKKLSGEKIIAAANLFAEIYHDDCHDVMHYLAELHANYKPLYGNFWQALLPKIIKRAVEKENIELILSVLNHFPQLVNKEILPGLTLLQLAAQSGKLQVVRALLETIKTIDMDACSHVYAGTTALLMALSSPTKAADVAAYLIRKGADLSISPQTGKTALLSALLANEKYVVSLLLTSNKDININQPLLTLHKKGYTALMIAAEQDDNEIFFRLLRVPAINVNLKNVAGESALFIAAARCDEIKIKALLSLPGIDVYAKRNDGKTAASIAEENGHTKIAAVLSFYHLVVTLLNGSGTPGKLKIDYINQLDNKTLTLIFERVADLGHDKETLAYIAAFFERLKETETHLPDHSSALGFFRDATRRAEHIKLLNQLFLIAHQSYYANRVDWEKKIRDEAVQEMEATLFQSPSSENIAFGLWAKSQTIFSKHRHVLSLGPTGAQRRIDSVVNKVRPKMK